LKRARGIPRPARNAHRRKNADRGAAVGDRAEGVRVGDRAWAPGVQFGFWKVLVAAAVAVLFPWRLLALITSW
jgi:hypothetical protein